MPLTPPKMNSETKHICVCICTYKRPRLLLRLLVEIEKQETQGLFTYSVVVADNDGARSAEPIVSQFTEASSVPVVYCVQPEQNIGRTRNMAVENARGDFIVFIDDDEFPVNHWLLDLFKTCNAHEVDGVLGPVRRHFDEEPPKWIIKGNFYERPIYPTGTPVAWREGRTGNVLLKKELFKDCGEPFKPEFRGGEDTDFFRRMIEAGHKFIWSAEAIAYEVVPPARWKRSFMLKRALLRGAVTLKHPTFGVRDVINSLVAVPIYTLALPFALLLGQHRFMDLLIRLFDHLGKLLVLVGFNPVEGHYITT